MSFNQLSFLKNNSVENNEKIEETTIKLDFFRHSIKSNDQVSKDDGEITLSEKGRMLSKEKAFTGVDMNQALAFGSPRVRTHETAGFVMAGASDDITGDESIDELKAKINKDLKSTEMGTTKIGVDNRLNFLDDETTPVGKELHDAASRGEYLKFIVEESDKLAKETSDTSGATYSRKAADIARIIEKYIKISPRWNQMVNQVVNEKSEKKYTPTLERYFATHQGMQESFLLKVIEKTDGMESRDEFVKSLSGVGFGFIEGFETQIVTKPDKSIVLRLKYNENSKGFSFEREVPVSMIKEIIGEDK